MNNQTMSLKEPIPINQKAQCFYSKMATGEIIVFISLMLFSIYIEISLNRPNRIMGWMFLFIFLIPSFFIYMLTWYYLRVDPNGITIFYRFHYKRIIWTEIIQISATMRHQKGKNTNYFVGSGIFVFYPYLIGTGAVQLLIHTSIGDIKTPKQTLRFKQINRFLHYIINLQKFSIQRIDNESNERGAMYYYVKWEMKSSNSLSKHLLLNDRSNLYL